MKLTEEEMKDPIRMQAANDTRELMMKFRNIVEEYFQKESVIPHNQKFLVINRAVGGHAATWFNHFLREMDPANKIEKNVN